MTFIEKFFLKNPLASALAGFLAGAVFIIYMLNWNFEIVDNDLSRVCSLSRSVIYMPIDDKVSINKGAPKDRAALAKKLRTDKSLIGRLRRWQRDEGSTIERLCSYWPAPIKWSTA